MREIPSTRIDSEAVKTAPIPTHSASTTDRLVGHLGLKTVAGISLVVGVAATGTAGLATHELKLERDKNAQLQSLLDSQREEEIKGLSKAPEIKLFNAGNRDPRKNLISFIQEVRSGITIVEFSMAQCYACNKVEPRLRSIAARNKSKFKTLKVFETHEDDALSEIKNFAKVNSYPTIIVFSGGKELGRIGGDNGERYLETELLRIIHDSHLN